MRRVSKLTNADTARTAGQMDYPLNGGRGRTRTHPLGCPVHVSAVGHGRSPCPAEEASPAENDAHPQRPGLTVAASADARKVLE